MTLRTRLFLLFAGLAAALVLAQWFWVRSLARGLEEEVGLVAVQIGETVASVLHEERLTRPAGAAGFEERVIVRRFGSPGAESEGPHVVRREMIAMAEICADESEPPVEGAEDCVALPDGVVLPEGNVEVRADQSTSFSWVFDVDHREDDETRDLVLHLRTLGDGQPMAIGYRMGSGPVSGEAPGSETDLETDIETEHRFVAIDRTRIIGDGSDLDGITEGAEPNVETWLATPGPHSTSAVRRIPLPESGIRHRLDDFARRSLGGAALLLALGVGAAALVAHRVSAPLGRLGAAAREIGGGALGLQVDAGPETGEVAEAIAAFNQMSRRLEELDARARDLEQDRHLAEIGEIARGLAHALRNPLNALGLAVEGLAAEGNAVEGNAVNGLAVNESSPEGGSPDQRAADRARRQIRRVDAAVRSFLILASEGAGAVAEVDVVQLARDVALEAHQDAAGRVRIRVDADGPVRLAIVEAEVRAVVQALAVNAIEASPDGEVVEIRVRAVAGGPVGRAGVELEVVELEVVELEVIDRGGGVPESVRERLFSPHVSTKSHGSGMGLFLAHRIATGRYGGGLELLSGEEGGTVARLRLGARRDREVSPV